jgi:hypothetical protein
MDVRFTLPFTGVTLLSSAQNSKSSPSRHSYVSVLPCILIT